MLELHTSVFPAAIVSMEELPKFRVVRDADNVSHAAARDDEPEVKPFDARTARKCLPKQQSWVWRNYLWKNYPSFRVVPDADNISHADACDDEPEVKVFDATERKKSKQKSWLSSFHPKKLNTCGECEVAVCQAKPENQAELVPGPDPDQKKNFTFLFQKI